MSRVKFGSGHISIGSIRLSCKNKQLCTKFRSSMVQFGSIWSSDLLSDELILNIESGIGPDHSVRILSLGLVLLDLTIKSSPPP